MTGSLALFWRLLLVVVLASAALTLAGPAAANPIPDGTDIPGAGLVDAVDGDCTPTDAPALQLPQGGVPGFFMGPPATPLPPAGEPVDLDRLWATAGTGGFSSATYDLGCGVDPRDWAGMLQATADTTTANGIVDYALATTALTDAVERRAWDPTWVLTVIEPFTERAASVITAEVLAPLVVVGALAALAVLLLRSRSGDPAAAAWGSAWAVFVVVVVAVILVSPARPAVLAQSGVAATVAALNDGADPATASTERVMRTVHYNSWLRRTLGSTDTPLAAEAGPYLHASTRWTYDELQRAAPDPAQRDAIAGAKAAMWAITAARVETEDPAAYRHLTGQAGDRTGLALLELAYALAANAFRLFVMLLLILCVLQVAVLTIVWLAAAVYLLTPAGEGMGRGLLNATGRAVLYVLAAALAAWGWGVWSEFALAPGISAWWSLTLLLVGLVVFWSLLRPDRKILSIASMGRVTGYGASARWLTDKALAYAITRKANGDAWGDIRSSLTREEQERFTARSEDYTPPPPPPMPTQPPAAARPGIGRAVYEGVVHDPPPPSAPGSGVRPFDAPIYYTRPAQQTADPAPPDPDWTPTGADVDLYRRAAP